MSGIAEDVHSSDANVDDLVNSARDRVASKPPRDPVASGLVVAILVIIILAFLTVAYSMFAGVLGTGAPRTMAEKRIVGARAKIDAGSTYRLDWMSYILALTDDGRYQEAQEWIDKGEKTLKDQDIYADMIYAQADLYAAQGKQDEALKKADEALKQITTRYEQGKLESKKTGDPDTASARGFVDTYWELLLLKAEIYEAKQDWKPALKAYDEYLAKEKTAATIFAKRGIVKEKLGDTKGARADYKQTLKFIPDDANAREGLQRIGAAQ